ncbi:MAG: HRDC domain-containing protein [Eubacterium sp.]|nr:HRDC domain-containing protein [Eubacterium sp.]
MSMFDRFNNADDNKLIKATLYDYELSIAKIILLCVDELPFSVGASKVAQILMGHQTVFLTENGFIDNSMYGRLQQFSKMELVFIIKSLAVNRYLVVNEALNVFDVVSVSPKGYSLLEGRRKLDFHFIDTICDVQTVPFNEADKQLLHALKDLRITLAMENGVKAYEICDDVTLLKLAHYHPSDLDELKAIDGIDTDFISNYGAEFIKAKDTD